MYSLKRNSGNHYAPVNVNHQDTPCGQTQGILKFLLSKSPSSFSPFVSDFPLFPTPGGWNLFILNARTASGSEHHCHNPPDGISESCQNPRSYLCPLAPPSDLLHSNPQETTCLLPDIYIHPGHSLVLLQHV